ncbi:MAG: M48 family metallopeptidase [Vibrio sp.]|uniref:M48 family metallopeptidase n=1 Tax=Vibrio sp. TaxID=678 RepID=UPI003A879600
MPSERCSTVTIGSLEVEIQRKSIKNIHLSVLPPNGYVRLSVPNRTSEDAIRLAIINKLGWIKQQQADFAAQPRQATREMVSGESHYVWGRQYRLDAVVSPTKHAVKVKNTEWLELSVTPNTTTEKRVKLLNHFYRHEMHQALTNLLPVWGQKTGVSVNEIGVKKMKTKWGSCNIQAKRIWLNSELAKKPPECLEYILVHEMVHLLERRHNDRFKQLMDRFMPNWRERRSLLNSLPLAYEDWSY